jgi:RNA polymerase sigma-70 factor (ECF subfamily)
MLHAADDAANQRLIDWLAATARGDQLAFRRLHDATRVRLLEIAREVLSEAERAEEALQEAFVKIWHAAARFDPSLSRPMTWLMRVVRNCAIDHARSRRSEAAATLPLEDGDAETFVDPRPTPEQQVYEQRMANWLERCVGDLAPAPRHVVSLVLHRGLSAAEIAAHHGLRLPQVRARLRSGVNQLALLAA